MFEYNAIITSVHDGDTLRADMDLGFGIWIKDQPIRVYGVDTPELITSEGKKASEVVKALLPVGSKIVIITFKGKREKYGRYLGKIKLPNGEDLASYLIANGLAKPYFGGTKETEP